MIAVDTSVAVPLLVATHPAHSALVTWSAGRDLALCGHAVAETYSVLTRLPGDLAVEADIAAGLIDDWFPTVVALDPSVQVHHDLAHVGIRGGAVYDALVGLAALTHGLRLATRDRRARGTYTVLGVDTEVI